MKDLYEVAFINEDDELVGSGIYVTVAANRDAAILQSTAEAISDGQDVTGCRVIVRPFRP